MIEEHKHTCKDCGGEVVGLVFWPRRQPTCHKCYGPVAPVYSSVSFTPLDCYRNYLRSKTNILFDFWLSKKIYQFGTEDSMRKSWAWVYVFNGDYQDIHEAHIQAAIQDGDVPSKISEEELRELSYAHWLKYKKLPDVQHDGMAVGFHEDER